MSNHTFLKYLLILPIILCGSHLIFGQQVPIQNYNINANGQVQLEVNSTTDKYYILKVRHHIDSTFDLPTSMALGASGTTIITESLEQYPLEYYQVLEYSIASPVDTDNDGVDDITEYQNFPIQSPLNAATPINENDGLLTIDSFITFKSLSLIKQRVLWSEFLNGKGFVKYLITDFHTDPKIYFINTNKHDLHADFAAEIGVSHLGDDVKKGQVIYHPTSISNNGTLGTFAFNYSNGFPEDFDIVQKTYELLARNMPFIKNNLSYFVTENNEDQYNQDVNLFQNSRISLLFEADVYADIDFWGLNPAEGYGFFRQMSLGEIPTAKDIVLYESLPNTLPRVGGVMTSVIQTPLSHVNLRAIQNEIPNAFIRNPLAIDSIADLLDHYIYFKVEQGSYEIREATLDEVNSWFDNIRPQEPQDPPLNLSYTQILPLDDISFSMFDGFGAKCANIATMRTFGFPEGTIPNGFGVPFYFYQEFMEYNNFFDEVDQMISNPSFQADRVIRNELLKAFRKKVKRAEMPDWMMIELENMQLSFPQGTSIRCRSSSNNEDLPKFNGAGLYDSKTQHPSEGHITKSIKQVYASLWNLRAFEERDFYRINHHITSMGVLCHPNYTDEKANGVGVSADPIYNTENTFYLNSQIGEELITNPDTNAIPEEILLDRIIVNNNDRYILVRHSNLVPSDSIIMGGKYLNQMRDYLSTIHDEFAILYHAVNNDNFAMDIEYKITSDDQLIIKQARPWVSYIWELDDDGSEADDINLKVFPNPALDFVIVECDDCHITKIKITNVMGQQIEARMIRETVDLSAKIFINNLSPGIYIISGFSETKGRYYSKKIVKQ